MRLFFFFTFLITSLSFSQEHYLSAMLIPSELKENANSVVRNQEIEIDIQSQRKMKIKKTKIITVLNSKGVNNVDAKEYYDKSTKIKIIEAVIYDAFGNELKKIKNKDFVDQSVADGFSIYSDNRMVSLDYTPIQYPYTVKYTSEIETSNTAFIPTWYPVDDYYESVEKSSISIKFLSELGFKSMERNFEDGRIIKQEESNKISYSVVNFQAKKYEELSPSFFKNNGSVLFGLNSFHLEGIDGKARDWDEFSKWVYSNLLNDNEMVSENTIQKLRELVDKEKDPIEISKIVYKFVQDRTRYVSIQLGIGGWKPMQAADVDRLGYGDCKALTNYTRVLLKKMGVESYYTIIYGGTTKKNIVEDFVSMQGNHAILSIPSKGSYVSLECTSQVNPFGYNGDFTDDRIALIIKPEKGELIKTGKYNSNNNSISSKALVNLNQDSSINGVVEIVSNGMFYEEVCSIENQSKINNYYKSVRFPWLNNLNINSYSFENDKQAIFFNEKIDVKIDNYLVTVGNSYYFVANIFNRNFNIPQRYRVRENSFEIPRNYKYEDVVKIKIPDMFKLESLPKSEIIESKYGSCNYDIKCQDNIILLKRTIVINEGFFDKTEYESYRFFIEQIVKFDNLKVFLTKN